MEVDIRMYIHYEDRFLMSISLMDDVVRTSFLLLNSTSVCTRAIKTAMLPMMCYSIEEHVITAGT